MIVIASNMKEACQYLKEKRERNHANHIEIVSVGGYCKPFSKSEYKQVKTGMKGGANRKAKTFSVTKLWNHNNLTYNELKAKY